MTTIPGMSGLAEALPLSLLLKATLVLCLAGLVALALRQSSAGRRHLVWSVAVLATLLVPTLALTPALHWDVPLLAAPAASSTSGPEATTSAPPSPVATQPNFPEAPAFDAPAARAGGPAPAGWWQRSSWPERLVALYLLGAALVLLRLAIGALLVRRMVRQAERLDSPDWQRPLMDMADRLGLDELPELRLSRRLPMPFACGLLRPTIVLPAEAEEWSTARRQAVLCHELAHLTRRDLPINLLSQCALAVYWFHPLMWVALRRLRVESERACDDLVLGTGTRPSEYADHLLQILRAVPRLPMPAAVLPFAQRGEFEGRVLAILEPAARRDAASRRGAALMFAAALLLIVPLAALRPVPRHVATPAEQWGASLITPDTGARSSVAAPTTGRERTTTATETRQAETRGADQPDPKPGPSPAPVAVPASALQLRTAPDSSVVINSLIGAMRDTSARVRQSAANSLGRLQARAAVGTLQMGVERDPSADVREMCAWALGNIRAPGTSATLARVIGRDTSSLVRTTAVWAAGQLASDDLLPALTAALRDPVTEVRVRAAWAIGTIHPGRAPSALVAAAQDSAENVRHRVAWALGQISDSTSLPALLRLIDDNSKSVRDVAFWALGNMEPTSASEAAMVKALEAPDPEIRAEAARALGGSRGRPWPWPWPWPR